MAKTIKLLLLKNVENLGIVGDIIKARPGYARNYLLPQGLAETPTPSKIESLKEARAQAQAELAQLRAAREELLGRMTDVRLTLVRSANDQGILYGSVTQRDISDALQEAGYDVSIRSVRLSQPIRRIGHYDVVVQFEKDLRTDIHITIEGDRPIDEREDMEIDDEGNMVEPGSRKGRGRARREEATEGAEAVA
ncbi:MAG TPA: 50S ribosomal protein L9 [Phycisphaerales bacterium]|nr:50S ribosomal protein L9 [Phycisphaerales bacterium]HRQ74836.1 50S ribosomal protein L9 [Phycisphaerales bacterium]